MGAYKLLIDGQLEDGDAVMDVVNPATEDVVSACPRASTRQLDKAVAAAKAAFPAWAKTPIAERKAALTARADTVGHNAFRTDFMIGLCGFKQSALGRESGRVGLLPLLESKAVLLDGEPAI